MIRTCATTDTKYHLKTALYIWPKQIRKRISHLVQQHETPRKKYKINKVQHFTLIIHTS